MPGLVRVWLPVGAGWFGFGEVVGCSEVRSAGDSGFSPSRPMSAICDLLLLSVCCFQRWFVFVLPVVFVVGVVRFQGLTGLYAVFLYA